MKEKHYKQRFTFLEGITLLCMEKCPSPFKKYFQRSMSMQSSALISFGGSYYHLILLFVSLYAFLQVRPRNRIVLMLKNSCKFHGDACVPG